MTSSTQQLAPTLDVDARLAEIERGVDLLLNVTPVNAAEAWAGFERALIQDLLDRNVLHPLWVRPRWLEVPGASERLDKLRAGASLTDLYEGDGAA